MSRGLDKTFHFEKLWDILYKAKQYETTCILHESFSSILEKHFMIVRPDLQCESPYFHWLWYFYLRCSTASCGLALAYRPSVSKIKIKKIKKNNNNSCYCVLCDPRLFSRSSSLSHASTSLLPSFELFNAH
jgi:hypothetical protein